jgi:hypothetical protein
MLLALGMAFKENAPPAGREGLLLLLLHGSDQVTRLVHSAAAAKLDFGQLANFDFPVSAFCFARSISTGGAEPKVAPEFHSLILMHAQQT